MNEITILDDMREVKINNNLKLREDGRLFFIKTGEEFIPAKSDQWNGYRLKVNGRTRYIHTLVLENFGDPKPEGNYRAWHINGDVYDNRLENLKWVSVQEISSNRVDALPVGQRRCDFDNINDYYCSNVKRYQEKNKDKIYVTTHEKVAIKKRNQYNNDEEKRQKHREICKAYYEKNKEKIKEYHKEYWKKWIEAHPNYSKNRNRNAETEKECTKRWREENSEKFKIIQKRWRAEHREELREYNKKWRAEHPEKIKEYKEREKEWYNEHPNYKKEYYQKQMSDPKRRENLYKQQRNRTRLKRATDEEFHQHELEYRKEYRARKKEEMNNKPNMDTE